MDIDFQYFHHTLHTAHRLDYISIMFDSQAKIFTTRLVDTLTLSI